MFNAISVFINTRRKKKDESVIVSPQELIKVLGESNLDHTNQGSFIKPIDFKNNVDSNSNQGDIQANLVKQNLDSTLQSSLEKSEISSGLNPNLWPKDSAQESLPTIGFDTQAKVSPPNEPTKVQINALSLSSIRKKKELENSLDKQTVDLQDLPKDTFSYSDLMQHWNWYADKLSQNKMMLMASLMGMRKPELNFPIINLELPNQGSKISFDENKFELVNFLRKQLNNYDIEIHIQVNEQIKVVSKVMSNKDKYLHFTQINPQIENLRQVFDLELK